MLFCNQQLHAQKNGSANGILWFGNIKTSTIALHKKEGFLTSENQDNLDKLAAAKDLVKKYPQIKPCKFEADSVSYVAYGGDIFNMEIGFFNKNFRILIKLEEVEDKIFNQSNLDNKKNPKDFGYGLNIRLLIAPFPIERTLAETLNDAQTGKSQKEAIFYSVQEKDWHLRITKITRNHIEGELSFSLGNDEWSLDPTGELQNLKFSIDAEKQKMEPDMNSAPTILEQMKKMNMFKTKDN